MQAPPHKMHRLHPPPPCCETALEVSTQIALDASAAHYTLHVAAATDIRMYTQALSHSVTHSLTHTLSHSHTLSLTHSRTHSFSYLVTCFSQFPVMTLPLSQPHLSQLYLAYSGNLERTHTTIPIFLLTLPSPCPTLCSPPLPCSSLPLAHSSPLPFSSLCPHPLLIHPCPHPLPSLAHLSLLHPLPSLAHPSLPPPLAHLSLPPPPPLPFSPPASPVFLPTPRSGAGALPTVHPLSGGHFQVRGS